LNRCHSGAEGGDDGVNASGDASRWFISIKAADAETRTPARIRNTHL
jgi:hypothetical protein